MLCECNALRWRRGCEAFRWNTRLASIAERGALQMAQRRLPFSHSGAGARFAEYPLGPGSTYGENLARSEGIRPMARALVCGWEDSPGHLRNLVGPFNSCGIGAATNDRGVTFVVQLLALLPEGAPGSGASGAAQDGLEAPQLQPGQAHHGKSSTRTREAFMILLAVIGLLIYKGGWMDRVL